MKAERFDGRTTGAARRKPLFVKERERARPLLAVAAVVVAMHGLIHLLGALTYLGLAKFDGLPYRTTLLDGRWHVGEAGARLFGVAWLIAATAFIVVGFGLLTGRAWWRRAALLASTFSAALCLLAWPDAVAGLVIDVAIMLAVRLSLPNRIVGGRRPWETTQ